MTFRTRFAPSPTGPLHLGHAYSARLAFDMAQAAGGRFLLRIEDIDTSRVRPEWEALILEDLHWLGLRWPAPVMRQSDRMAVYDAALDVLWRRGLLYPCTCKRADIAAALSAPQEGVPTHGPDGLIYPGLCRPTRPFGPDTPRPKDAVLRLDMARACALPQVAGTPMAFEETGAGPQGETGMIEVTPAQMCTEVGDIILARAGMGTSYHLSVVLDDAAQGITDVIRGQDLFDATRIHVVLQHLLGRPTPRYHHHALVRDGAGKRLAKRDDARAIRLFRQDGLTPEETLAKATP